jgi:predicted ATPase with chaperone activity
MARTTAELAGAENITPEHVAGAASYRRSDRKL